MHFQLNMPTASPARSEDRDAGATGRVQTQRCLLNSSAAGTHRIAAQYEFANLLPLVNETVDLGQGENF